MNTANQLNRIKELECVIADLQAECQALRAEQPAQQNHVGVFCEDDDIGHVRLDPHQQIKLKDGDKLYTTPPQRKPLFIGKESAEFAEWFNAVWLGDGEQGETIPTSGKEYDDYLSQYTLAFGAWMAAKETAHGIKE